MKQLIVTILLLFVTSTIFANEPVRIKMDHIKNIDNTFQHGNYQQFKYEFINLELENQPPVSNLIPKKKDYLMLYVAGGIVVATVALVALNDPENFSSNTPTETNLGIAIGGTFAAGLFLTKYLIDNR